MDMAAKNYVPAFNYDFLTPFYDCFVELLGYGQAQRNRVIDLLHLKPDEKLLDVGCGTGTLLVLAKKRYLNLDMTGIDIDTKALEIAEKKAIKEEVNIRFIQSGVQKLPFKDAFFDVVVSTLIFHHLPTEVKRAALEEIYRVLSKNGRFLLADFGNREGLILHALDFITGILKLPEHETLQDNLNDLVPQFIQQAGFKVKEIAPRYRGVKFLLGKKK